MAMVTIRDLRNHGGDVIERVRRGERITITRAGKAVAELLPVAQPKLSADVLLRRWRHLPPIDPEAFRADVDELLDSSL